MPLISFVIPVYNVASYLHECLDSVVGQDFSDFEVCIVDDGSTDGGGAICNEYAAAYPGLFKLKHQPNQGVSVARNNAIKWPQANIYGLLMPTTTFCPARCTISPKYSGSRDVRHYSLATNHLLPKVQWNTG